MKKLSKSQNIGIALVVSVVLFMAVNAATPYSASEVQLNDSEFPRVQVALDITGDTNGLLAKHFEIVEVGRNNVGPLVVLPPNKASNNLDLRILIDTSGRTSKQADLIRTNLRGLVQYIFEAEMTASIYIKSFDGTQDMLSTDLQGAINNVNDLTFSGAATQKIDGFGMITAEAGASSNPNTQKVLLIVNGSDFEDDNTDDLMDPRMNKAIGAVYNNCLAFVLGHPLKKIHAVRAGHESAEFIDFSHSVPGGYIGGFGADLTSMVDLLKMQSEQHFVLQYYSIQPTSSYAGSSALLRIDGFDVHTLVHKNLPATSLAVNHLPANELVLGENVDIDVDLGNYGKMINAVELNYENKSGIFETINLFHKRSASTEETLRYTGQVPNEVMNDENFSYYISVHTPYSSIGAGSGLVTVPVNAYDDGIILKATLVNNEEVLWTWEGPTVAKGRSFEVWSGDTLLTTTSKKNHTIPLTNCNHYQIVQVKVIFADGTKSYPSRPYEYYAKTGIDGPITEKDGVQLMIECIEEKENDSYSSIANTNGFSANSNLNLERAGIYMARIIAKNIWEKIEDQADYFELLYYIMIFIDREEYTAHGIEGTAINESLVHKLISRVNNTENINQAYDDALEELSNRLRSTLSL